MKILYETHATASGNGRDGTASIEDGALTLSLSTPKALGGAGGEGTNPEQLFASGYAACFLSALKFIAGRQKQRLPDDASVTVTVGIGPPRGRGGLCARHRAGRQPARPRRQERLGASGGGSCHLPLFAPHPRGRAGAAEPGLSRPRENP